MTRAENAALYGRCPLDYHRDAMLLTPEAWIRI